MHELAITTGVVDAVADRFDDRRVSAVRLEVGRLSGVVCDAVRFCFDAVADGTTLAGARLDVDEPAGHGRCRACGADVTMPDALTACRCGGVEIDVIDGRQLLVTAVELAPLPSTENLPSTEQPSSTEQLSSTDRREETSRCAEPAAVTAR